MKNQEELNEEYNKKISEAKEKLLYEYATHYTKTDPYITPSNANEIDWSKLKRSMRRYSVAFNDEYKNIYLRPYMEVIDLSKSKMYEGTPDSIFYKRNFDIQALIDKLPTLFWDTPHGEHLLRKKPSNDINIYFKEQVNQAGDISFNTNNNVNNSGMLNLSPLEKVIHDFIENDNIALEIRAMIFENLFTEVNSFQRTMSTLGVAQEYKNNVYESLKKLNFKSPEFDQAWQAQIDSLVMKDKKHNFSNKNAKISL